MSSQQKEQCNGFKYNSEHIPVITATACLLGSGCLATSQLLLSCRASMQFDTCLAKPYVCRPSSCAVLCVTAIISHSCVRLCWRSRKRWRYSWNWRKELKSVREKSQRWARISWRCRKRWCHEDVISVLWKVLQDNHLEVGQHVNTSGSCGIWEYQWLVFTSTT